MEVILGKDAYIEFLKNDTYVAYACCETVEITVSTEEISVKTIGDGKWDTTRAQKHSYTISGSGVVRYDDATVVNGFDLLNYQIDGVHVQYRMIFKKWNQDTYTMIYGTALVTSTNLTAPADFVSHSFEMRGKGPLNVGVMPTCTKAITSYTVTRTIGFIYQVAILTLNSGTVPRYDFRLDGGGIETRYDTGWTFSSGSYGNHVLEIWPVCDNNIRGTKTTHNFTTTL